MKIYRIGEAAEILNLKSFVLRFWETEFKELTPQRTHKGQRFYSEEDLRILKRIKFLLHEKGLTIEGAKKALLEELNKTQTITKNIDVLELENPVNLRLQQQTAQTLKFLEQNQFSLGLSYPNLQSNKLNNNELTNYPNEHSLELQKQQTQATQLEEKVQANINEAQQLSLIPPNSGCFENKQISSENNLLLNQGSSYEKKQQKNEKELIKFFIGELLALKKLLD